MMKNRRNIIQLAFAVFFNGYILGFFKGKIFKGATKQICLPVLNCYSCPGALGACPIGAMQAVLGHRGKNFSFYVLGSIMLFGIIFGRLICGFMCPFGFFQDLLYKIKVHKKTVPKKVDMILRHLKYLILIFFVVLMPLFLTNQFGLGAPYFCKLICPVGTLEGGIPLLMKNEALRNAIGFLFNWKMLILIVVSLLSMFICRPFCKYICPLGAFYALFNKVSFYQMSVDKEKCTNCKICEKQCPMNVEITKNINSGECIRCSQCKNACPHNAISSKFKL